VAIVSTVASYLVSQKGIALQLDLLRKYHIDRQDSALSARNWFAEQNERLAYISATGFVLGVIFLIAFFGVNTSDENRANKKTIYPPAIAPQVQVTAPPAVTPPAVTPPAVTPQGTVTIP
jgi:hypothetical protein